MVAQRVVDVREDAPQGEASFDQIAEAVETLGRHEELVVLNATRVGSLYRLMAERGFTHDISHIPDGGRRVTFRKAW
jgi:hypothetical protein